MRLQGAISPRVEARLDEMLGHPETCPHGNPIDAETARRRPAGIRLSEIEAGAPGDDLPDHRGGRGGRRPAVLPRGAGAHARRARHDPRPQRIARLADARRAARAGDARPPAGGPRPGPARRGRPGAVPSSCPHRPARRMSRRRASGSPRARPARSTSGRRGRRCSTTSTRATPAARSSSASRTRTRRAARSRYEKDILDGLHWLGLSWDEGPEVAGEAARGPFAPYRQMQRLPLYAEAAERLLAADLAYPCYCTPEELDADRKAQEAAKLAAALRRALRDADARGASRARGGGPPAGPPLPGRGGRRRLRRHRPRPRRDRRRQPRRRLRDRPRRRHAALPLHGRRRRRGDGDHPRHPRRGPPLEHAQAHPAVPGARPRRCRSSPTCRSSSTPTGRR